MQKHRKQLPEIKKLMLLELGIDVTLRPGNRGRPSKKRKPQYNTDCSDDDATYKPPMFDRKIKRFSPEEFEIAGTMLMLYRV